MKIKNFILMVYSFSLHVHSINIKAIRLINKEFACKKGGFMENQEEEKSIESTTSNESSFTWDTDSTYI